MIRLSFHVLLAAALLAADRAAARGIIIDGGDVPRVGPLVRIPAGPGGGQAAAAIAVFVNPQGQEIPAERDPANPQVLWLQWPGELKGKSPLLTLKEWRAVAPSSSSSPTAPFIAANGKVPAWTYHAAVDPAPAGKSPLLARSGFIHPLCAPDGTPLTDSRPSDHWHHMGLWHAWTSAAFRGKPVDFWNIADGHGTVRFKHYLWRHHGTVWQGFAARQEAVAWPGTPGETTVLDEQFTTRSWQAGGMNLLDYEITQTNVTADPLELKAYRYGGGVCFRGRPDWKSATSGYLTSEGLTRKGAHQSRARWVAAYGMTEAGNAGMAILGAPDNLDAPQRLRTWQADHGGAIFANFVPTQEHPTVIPPGGRISLRYRIVTFHGMPDKAKLDAAWEDFARPATVEILP